ncbi:MAG TPA: DinB family protein [Flavobacteriales bacterium]|nr:DinB family protein [Flavobacteriales bacterium]
MNYLTIIQGELDTIAQGNKKVLERLPADKLGWKPHEKSMTLGRLAQHIAELPHWMGHITAKDHFDFVRDGYKILPAPASVEEILKLWETSYAQAKKALEGADGVDMEERWEMRRDGQVIAGMPRRVAYGTQLQHMVHHRGQLTVYLRLLNVPVPGLFGPSADEH